MVDGLIVSVVQKNRIKSLRNAVSVRLMPSSPASRRSWARRNAVSCLVAIQSLRLWIPMTFLVSTLAPTIRVFHFSEIP